MSEEFPRTLFQFHLTCEHLQRVSKSRGRLIRSGEDPALSGLWARYHAIVLYNIDQANQLLRDDEKYTDGAPATLAILQLLLSDLKAALFLWKAHLRGFLAYVRLRGGASKIMSLPKPEKSRLSPVLAYVLYS